MNLTPPPIATAPDQPEPRPWNRWRFLGIAVRATSWFFVTICCVFFLVPEAFKAFTEFAIELSWLTELFYHIVWRIRRIRFLYIPMCIVLYIGFEILLCYKAGKSRVLIVALFWTILALLLVAQAIPLIEPLMILLDGL